MDKAEGESIPGRENSMCKGTGIQTLWHILEVVTGCAFLFVRMMCIVGKEKSGGEYEIVEVTGDGSQTATCVPSGTLVGLFLIRSEWIVVEECSCQGGGDSVTPEFEKSHCDSSVVPTWELDWGDKAGDREATAVVHRTSGKSPHSGKGRGKYVTRGSNLSVCPGFLLFVEVDIFKLLRTLE